MFKTPSLCDVKYSIQLFRIFCVFPLYFQCSNIYIFSATLNRPAGKISYCERSRSCNGDVKIENVFCVLEIVSANSSEQFYCEPVLPRPYLLRFPYLRGADLHSGCTRCVLEQVQYPINSKTFTSSQWPLRRLAAAAISFCRVVIGRSLFADCTTYEFRFDSFSDSNFYYCFCQQHRG